MLTPPHPTPSKPVRLAVVTCAVLEEEFIALAQGVESVVHIEVVEQGLHNDPPLLRTKLQETVARIENLPGMDVQAIVLGYGLCSRGIEGVTTRRTKLVVVRAHDCVTLLLGSKERYAQYVKDHPGTYWYSTGWNRYSLMPGKDRYEKLRSKYVAQYGEDNADFLMESEQHWFKTYNRATFVDLTVRSTEAEVSYTKECAKWLNWNYDYQKGDPALIRSLVRGDWDEDRFLVLEPGQTLRLTADERIIEATST